MKTLKATVFNIQKFSTEDGPGIRTTVFMKGCPLRCAWCHNPEGLLQEPEAVWHDVRCIAARECLQACPHAALRLEPQGITIDRSLCDHCGRCAEVCPGRALEIIGKCISAEDLFQEIIQDEIFYQTSGGGVTFSGGEPLLQSGFLQVAMLVMKNAGLHIALDTCGAVSRKATQRLLESTDLVLLDLKIMDPRRHLQATGMDNRLVLENARRLADAGIRMWIRTPVIPGYTQDARNIQAIGEFIDRYLATVERWELLAYTNLGKPKYHRLELPYTLETEPLFSTGRMEAVLEIARKCVPFASWSGATNPVSMAEIRKCD